MLWPVSTLRSLIGDAPVIADTTELIVCFITTGVIDEGFIAGMSWDQVLHARMLGAALMIPVGRPYGVLRELYTAPSLISRPAIAPFFWTALRL